MAVEEIKSRVEENQRRQASGGDAKNGPRPGMRDELPRQALSEHGIY